MEKKIESCIYCGSTNIKRNIRVGETKELKGCGLKYVSFLTPKCEDLYADLCRDCGSVRLFVKNSDRPWDNE